MRSQNANAIESRILFERQSKKSQMQVCQNAILTYENQNLQLKPNKRAANKQKSHTAIPMRESKPQSLETFKLKKVVKFFLKYSNKMRLQKGRLISLLSLSLYVSPTFHLSPFSFLSLFFILFTSKNSI